MIDCFTCVTVRCFELNTEVKQQKEPFQILHCVRKKVPDLKHKDPIHTTSTKQATLHYITLST